jgi:hypothetical protein
MSPIIKTNPAFAHIAYRRAIVVQLVQDLRDSYMTLSGTVPKKAIICDDVFREESTVPQEELADVMQELELEAANLKLELLKFTFTRKESDGLLSSTTREEGSEDSGEAGSAKGRRKRRRGR